MEKIHAVCFGGDVVLTYFHSFLLLFFFLALSMFLHHLLQFHTFNLDGFPLDCVCFFRFAGSYECIVSKMYREPDSVSSSVSCKFLYRLYHQNNLSDDFLFVYFLSIASPMPFLLLHLSSCCFCSILLTNHFRHFLWVALRLNTFFVVYLILSFFSLRWLPWKMNDIFSFPADSIPFPYKVVSATDINWYTDV